MTERPPQGPEEERRAFAVPPATGEVDGIDLALLDPSDPDERRLLIEAEHPELREALERDEEILVGGEPMNPRLHITMHEIVANQLWNDDPPEVWQTAQRLLADGYERHEVLHMLASVVSTDMWAMLARGAEVDRNRYVAALDKLPASYFALAE
jgi:hypothetical protein